MKLLTFLITGLVSALPVFADAPAAPQHPAKPLLWKVTGGKLTKPSYLFGTIHLGRGPLANLHPAAQQAFDACDTLFTEIPMDAATQLAASQAAVRNDGKTLTESIGPDLTKRLKEELALVNPALDVTPFQQLKTWVVAATLPALKEQLQGTKALDAILWEKATAAHKQTLAIETAKSQIACFDAFTEAELVRMLDETLRQLKQDRDAGKDSTKDLIAAYLSGDCDRIVTEMNRSMELTKDADKELGEKFIRILLTERDVTMAAKIAEILAEHPDRIQFFAAGAAHFAGTPGIITPLRKLGYQVTRIEE